ncbi:MAG: AMIN domain-containing protein, partial [Candidatus Latescibacteria bacterium]|nr:AMIN domain-containing protein [bacterium]MBD3424621.1 AMIN domain-containing protein [Candidatus Latescibacterota bacterium]
MRKVFGISLVLIASFIIPGGLLFASAPGAEINGLNMEQIQNELKIEISKTGNVQFEIFSMKNPARLVVDCKGATYDLPRTIFQAQSPLAYRIRTSQFSTQPEPVCRLVIDLKKDVSHRQFDKDGKHVVVLTGNAALKGKADAVSEAKWEKVVARGEKAEIEKKHIDVAGADMGSGMAVIKVDNTRKAVSSDGDDSTGGGSDETVSPGKEKKQDDSPWIISSSES